VPKYCPICLSEFKAGISDCPKDKVPLVSQKPKEFERLMDIYAASDEIEAERIIVFLRDNDMIAKETRTGISQMPVASDTRFLISVLKETVDKAKRLIEKARNDGVISRNGNFL
jgi:hypothetical protein